MALYRDAAIVLRTQKLGEADRIVTLLTRQHGKVRAVAKGVRRTRSRFGARLEPSMVVDVQLYEGRSLDTVTQAETLAPYGDVIARDYVAYTAATAMLETAERLTEERAPALQQFLLLAGGLQLAGRRRARDRAGARRLPAALARRRRLGAELPRLRALRRARARTRPSTSPAAAPSARPAAPPGSAAPALQTLELLAALLAGDWALADASAHAAPPRGQRPGHRLPAVAPRAGRALPAAGGAGMTTPSLPAPLRGAAAGGARRPRAPARGHRHGRQRPVGQRPRPAAHQGPRGRRGLAAGRRRRLHRDRRRATCRPTRSRPRTGSARPTRSASSWASTAT